MMKYWFSYYSDYVYKKKEKKNMSFFITNSASLIINKTLDDEMKPEGRNDDKF